MLNDFLKFIRQNRLAIRKDRIVLAVSGGIDSMVMAHLFIEAGYTPGIAHCNFSLRGREADLDEELVRQFASEHKLEFYSVRFDTKEYAREKKLSVQMAARELRYEWFEKIRREGNFCSTAVAHNLNDNVETILINLIRGTGITGFTGMKPSGNGIIRPLLFATRSRIKEFSSNNGVVYREDTSNAETRYMRNKIRHLVVPVLKEINPFIEESILATAKRLEGTLEILTNYIESIRNFTSHKNGEITAYNIGSLSTIPLSSSLIFELFKPYGINSTTSVDLLNVLNGRTGGQILTASHRLIRNRDELIVSPLKVMGTHEFNIDDFTGFSVIPLIASAEIIDYNHDMKFPDDKLLAFLDYEKISFPVTVRKWKKGDLFFPFGMKHKKKGE